MKRIVKVNNYNIAQMTAKNWNFYVGGRKITKKMARQGLRLGSKIIKAKWKGKL